MCGRYTLFTDTDSREIMRIIQEVSRRHPEREVKTGEIFPTNAAPVLLRQGAHIQADVFGWGFPKFGGSAGVIINARSETAQDKPMFRNSLLFRRCVVPSTGFYEWSQDRAHQKYLFTRPGDSALYMAGLYNVFDGQPRYVILTRAANSWMRDIHHRMPVILPPDQLESWCSAPVEQAAKLLQCAPELVRQAV